MRRYLLVFTLLLLPAGARASGHEIYTGWSFSRESKLDGFHGLGSLHAFHGRHIFTDYSQDTGTHHGTERKRKTWGVGTIFHMPAADPPPRYASFVRVGAVRVNACNGKDGERSAEAEGACHEHHLGVAFGTGAFVRVYRDFALQGQIDAVAYHPGSGWTAYPRFSAGLALRPKTEPK